MSKIPALRLLKGRTDHVRFLPFEHRFSYRLFLIDIDIDRLDEANRASRLFSIDRPNLFSFRRRDNGARVDAPLRDWAQDRLGEAGIDSHDTTIRLVTFPRHLGYKFAPLSLWFAHAPDGGLRGLIYEVNNTFGETHAYVAPVSGQTARHEADKRFHVSPFFDVAGQYRFSIRRPDDGLGLVIDSLEAGQRLHMATIKAAVSPASDGEFLKAALVRPLSSLGVTFGIHWQALKLWMKGASYRSRPTPPETISTVAKPLTGVGEETR